MAGPVIIDEIQKLPSLLDEVQNLIESRGLRFVLSGSSPAKPRRGGVNLLGARARTRHLHPFVSAEVPQWDMLRAVSVGGIPSIYCSEDPVEDLRAYCGNYLQLEIQAEGKVRGIERFSRFFSAAASDAGVPARTVREYFQILEDTLVGILLQPFSPPSARRKPVSHAKLYFFDVGVANVLAGRTRIEDTSAAFGRALEHLIFCELRAWLAYRRDPRRLRFWRSTDGSEVDFVVGDEVAIEVKASARIAQRDLIGMKRLAEEATLAKRIVVCTEHAPRILDGVRILPVRDFLGDLWTGEVL